MPADPHFEREAQKYENPIPSREFILQMIEERKAPASFDQLVKLLKLEEEEQTKALRYRLRAMERDGQLVFTRSRCYALPSRLNMLQGYVMGHRDGYGFFRPDDGEGDLFLSAREMEQLMHGDYILAQANGESYRGKKEARLVRVLKSRENEIVGRYFIEDGIGMVVPDDQRICQDIIIPPEENRGARQSQIVVVELIHRPSRRRNAVGRITEVLGEQMAPGMETEMALRTHGIPHTWPEEVTKAVKGLKEEVPESAKKDRMDLRELPLVTIDGEDARDFDDAVFCERKRLGGWRLWVAIADVSHYVKLGTALDKEAYTRGNSVYFPDQVVPMLPEVLSNGLCSLNPKVDRLCMVCEMTVSKAGRLSGYKFYPAVMNSHARLTYTKVAAMLEGDKELREQYAPLVPHIEELHNLYQALNAARKVRGAMEFESQETRFIFNAERKIDHIVPLVRNDAHKLIEECMILANIAAARYVDKHKAAALFRTHARPGEEKLTAFHSFLGELGLSLNGGNQPQPKDFAELARKIEGRPDAELIQTMLLRSMKQAIYEGSNEGHFGLALTAYAHFTSPIRRYPDLILHRAIKYLFKKEQGLFKKKWTSDGGFNYQHDETDGLGEHCSMTERRADDATREVSDRLKCEFMQDHVGLEFDGVIAAVTGFGFFVRLRELHIDGLVHVSSLQNDYYQFDPQRQSLIGESFRRVYRLGDELRVKVVRADPEDRKIDFELVGEDKGKQRRSRPGKSSAKPVKTSGAEKEKGARASTKRRSSTSEKKAPKKRSTESSNKRPRRKSSKQVKKSSK
ncbi:ribonuclease R [Dongshaea marina]|uniref:ribonuclease R n=1 Tax=Dongshaea marina TaxID=2047966 RepID=UPI000D3E2EC5|nr:ribonuclease R [Dongshaea marina]